MDLRKTLRDAKAGSEAAVLELLKYYKPLLVNKSKVRGCFDEDLYQEQCITLLHCIRRFAMDMPAA